MFSFNFLTKNKEWWYRHKKGKALFVVIIIIVGYTSRER